MAFPGCRDALWHTQKCRLVAQIDLCAEEKEMTKRQQETIDEFMGGIPAGEREVYNETIHYLVGLGYVPQKNRSFLSFRHKANGKIIAKIKYGEIRIKFFACKNIPDKYIDALRSEMDENNGQYSMPVPSPDPSPVPEGGIMKKCTLSCSVCTGGKMRYYHRFPDGEELFRCGAYPVLIPNIKESDLEELKRLLFEQHTYFLSIA